MAAHIRLAQSSDAAGILAIYAPYCDSTCVSFEVVSPTIGEMRERISNITAGYPWLVGEIDGQIAGYVYASRHREPAAYRWAVDVAAYVAPAQHRRGLGQILYDTLFSILREQGFYTAIAGITLPNPASVGLHERMGFSEVGVFHRIGYKCDRWLNVGWWELDLQPERHGPPDPQAFSSICGNAAISAALAEGQRKLAAKLEFPDT
jgi:L-amino acid N-acyltransferase YncA